VATRRRRQPPATKGFCKSAARLIQNYISGDLDRKTTVALERHLIQCPDCVSFLTTYKATARAARSLRYEDIPAEMQKRIEEFLAMKSKESSSGG
jgi:anti-sigma factor RsiW